MKPLFCACCLRTRCGNVAHGAFHSCLFHDIFPPVIDLEVHSHCTIHFDYYVGDRSFEAIPIDWAGLQLTFIRGHTIITAGISGGCPLQDAG